MHFAHTNSTQKWHTHISVVPFYMIFFAMLQLLLLLPIFLFIHALVVVDCVRKMTKPLHRKCLFVCPRKNTKKSAHTFGRIATQRYSNMFTINCSPIRDNLFCFVSYFVVFFFLSSVVIIAGDSIRVTCSSVILAPVSAHETSSAFCNIKRKKKKAAIDNRVKWAIYKKDDVRRDKMKEKNKKKNTGMYSPYIRRHKCLNQSFEWARIHLVDFVGIYLSWANSMHSPLKLNYERLPWFCSFLSLFMFLFLLHFFVLCWRNPLCCLSTSYLSIR